MADRRVWWGVGVLTIGIGAALLTGSATASADDGTDSGSSQSSTGGADHDTAKSGSGADSDSSSPRHSPKATAPDSTPTTTSTGAEHSSVTTAAADQSTSESGSTTTTTKTADKPSGSKHQQTPQRVVQVRITKPTDTETSQATTDPADHPSTKTTVSDAVSDPPATATADVTEVSTPVTPDVTAPSSSDPTALPRGPTAVRSQTPKTLAVVQILSAPLLAPVVDEPTTSATVEQQSTTVSQPLSSPTATEPTAAPTPSEPTTTPVQNGPVAALVSVDPQLVPMLDPTITDPTASGAPTMRFAAMQTMAASQLFSSAVTTPTTPIVPVVIQAPPTVGPIASAILDILASFGWRASPLAVAVFPSLAPWAAGAAVPTPIPAVLDTSAGAPPTTAGTVLVGHSTLYIPCGPNGYAARTDWYFPVQQVDPVTGATVNPQGIIYLQNGFLANSGFYSALATNLAANTNSIVVVPTITSNPFSCFGCWLNGASMQQAAANLFVGNRDALLTSAQAAGYVGAGLPDPFVLSGHSAGGGFAAAMASYTVDNGAASNLRGVVMFDGVPPLGLMYGVVPKLNALQIPIYQIAAQNQIWNIWGSGTNELVASNPGGFNGVVIYHGSHVDSMLGGNPVVDFFAQLVTQFSPPGATQAVYTFADGWINDMYAGTPPVIGTPLYPAPNVPVQVGPATAYGLPSPTGQRSRLGELIYGIISFFSSLFGA